MMSCAEELVIPRPYFPTEKGEMLDQLEQLTIGMDVPDFKRRNPKWLLKNLGFRNSEHPDFSKVLELSQELISRGIAFG